MKNTALLFAALAAAFSISSCTKEMNEMLPSSELKVNITVSEPEISTKAVKSGWANGDKINVWFDRSSNQTSCPSTTPDAVLTYNGSSWSCSTITDAVKNELSSSGYIYYFYEGSNALNSYSLTETDNSNHVSTFYAPYDGTNWMRMPMVVSSKNSASDDRKYTYDSGTNTLDLTLESWAFKTNIQVVVYNMPATITLENCTLKISTTDGSILTASSIQVRGTNNGCMNITRSGLAAAKGFANSESDAAGKKAVEFHMVGTTGATGKHTFTFNNGTTEKSYTLTSDMTFTGSETLQAFKIDYSKFNF